MVKEGFFMRLGFLIRGEKEEFLQRGKAIDLRR